MGRGPRLLILWHGFADSGQLFGVLASALAARYTILAPDLPGHGHTPLLPKPWQPAQLAAWIEAWCEQEGATQYELGGFSMGGRLALGLLPWLHALPERLWLLAPDGLGTRWAWLLDATPGWMRRALAPVLLRPACLLTLARMVHFAGWLDRRTWLFLRYQLHTLPRRRRLAHTWCALARFKVRPRQLDPLLLQLSRRTCLLMGARDPMVRPRAVERFAARYPEMELVWLPAAHEDLVGTPLAQWWAAHA